MKDEGISNLLGLFGGDGVLGGDIPPILVGVPGAFTKDKINF